MLRRPAAAVAALAAAALALPASASATTELNVIPHGQWGGAPPSWSTAPGILPADTQARMYDRLTTLFRKVTDAQLAPSTDGTGFFKSAKLLDINDPSYITTEVVSGEVPGIGPVTATVRRDAYGAPGIYSNTDAGATFAAGYVVAQDRSLLLNQARTNGIASLIDMPGVSGIQLVLGLYDYKPSKQVVDEVVKQQETSLKAAGPQGEQVLRDIDIYVAGINQWYALNQPSAPKWTRADIFAVNGIKAQFLGEGGGEEVGNAEFLNALQRKHGSKKGLRIWQDLRQRNDPETSATTSKQFPWQKGDPTGKGVVGLRSGSFDDTFVRLPGATAARTAPAEGIPSTGHPRGLEQKASNILIVGGKRSATGSPLFVGGPQIGYNYPGLTGEMGIYSPSIRVRGATSAPFPGYMLIGRGEGYAWTLTSAGTDMVDTYAETLCGGSKRKYSYKGKCRSMEKVDAGTISKSGKTTKAVFYRTVHGPVIGYAKSAKTGKTVALAQRRSSYGEETVDQLFNQQMTYGRVKNAKDFIEAAKKTPQTFNSFYASKTEMAFYTSGKLPMRAKGADGDLPTDGRGSYEWKGYLAKSKQPQVINPSSGLIVNWNNKPAKGFPGSDERWAEGSLQRVDTLLGELKRKDKHTLASVLDAANAGATQDVRVYTLWPTLKAVLDKDKGKTATTRATNAYKALDAWYKAGSSRVDSDRNGFIDAPGAAVIDAAWERLATAALCTKLGKSLCAQLESRNGIFDQPPGGQYGGWHQYMWKDLRALLGKPVKGRYSTRYCGNGKLSSCSAALWKALDAGTSKLGSDASKWQKSTKDELIQFSPLPLFQMQYTNRPSGIHQVMHFGD